MALPWSQQKICGLSLVAMGSSGTLSQRHVLVPFKGHSTWEKNFQLRGLTMVFLNKGLFFSLYPEYLVVSFLKGVGVTR